MMNVLLGETETADILAGRYVDGLYSYRQTLRYATSYAVSKKCLDQAIISWRMALGEAAFIKDDVRRGLEVVNG